MIVTSATGSDTPSTVLARAGNDWRTCAFDLIRWLVANDRCFSSGEVAHYIRTHRPDVSFSVLDLGNQVRDWYYGQEFPSYGSGLYPAMVPRTTAGVYRTQAGVRVFVYAPSADEGRAHDFEVEVPLPPAVDGQPPRVAPSDPATITGSRRTDDELLAVVRADRRCVIPRAAFEFFVHATGRTIRIGSDPVHITFSGDEARITLDPTPTSTPYHLWAGRGRVAFASGTGTPFTPGQRFRMYVSPNALVVRVG
jgi:hypothetical protein